MGQYTAGDTNYADYYRTRYAQLYKAYAADPDDISMLVAMANFYSQKNNPMRNLPMAMKYATRAEKNYLAIVDDRQQYKTVSKLIRNKITVASVRQLKSNILAETRNYIANTPTLPESEMALLRNVFANDSVVLRELERHRYNQDFDRARSAGTIGAYYLFLKNHSGTAGAEYAQNEIARQLQLQLADVNEERYVDSAVAPYADCHYIMLLGARHKSHIAYTKATAAHTVEGYRDFLRKHPQSDEYSDALEQLQGLLALQFNTLRTPEEYADFALKNPDDTLADIAMQRLRNIVLTSRDEKALAIYMHNFPLDSLYDYIYRQSYEWRADEGNAEPMRLFLEKNADCPFAMNINADLRRAARTDSIDLRGRVTEQDIPLYTEYTRATMGKRISYVALLRSLQPYIAAHNWKRATAQAKASELVFEDYYNDLYNQLDRLLSSDNPNYNAGIAELTLTGYDVVHPYVTSDGKRMYYTRRNTAGHNQICVSHRAGAGWQVGTAIKISDRGAAVGEDDTLGWQFFGLFAADTQMLVGRGGDIAIATREPGGWRITELPPYPVNTDYYETDPFMLPDGTGMLICSDRPGGHNYQISHSYFHGDTALATDIYFIPRTEGGWGTPVNLGIPVNSPYCELSPVMSRDMHTLYFASDAQGLGYADIYATTRSDASSWTQWSQPLNLGRAVNTAFHDASISLSEDERKLYYSSAPQGERQICRSITLSANPSNYYRTASLNLSSLNGRAAMAHIDVVDADAQLVIYKYAVDNFDKPLTTRLHKDKHYVVHVKAGNLYIPSCEVRPGNTATTCNFKGYSRSNIMTDTVLTTVSSVDFLPGKTTLMPWSWREIESLADWLKQNCPQGQPECHTEIIVHCEEADDTLSYRLSLARGSELKRTLVDMGVPPSALSVSAYGNVMYKEGRRPKSTVMVRIIVGQ